MISEFFIRRPIVAMVIAILTVIVGIIAILGLPLAQFPDIVPPQIQVSANYGGAGAYNFAVARSVAGNPGGSLFLRKPSGAVAHGGGTVAGWASGAASYNAAASWINGGLKP